MDYLVNDKMTPADAIKTIKRFTAKGKVVIRISAEVSMPAGENTHYPYYLGFEVTRRVAFDALGQMQKFHERKVERNEAPALTKISITDAGTERKPIYLVWIG
ncbi:hypothetical protein [Synechococcus phage Ssp-JY38]|nr:hypothetical protein [Synechococcus phage Yong-L2-223]